VATAWAMGISLDLVTAGIETFDWDLRQPRPTVAKTTR